MTTTELLLDAPDPYSSQTAGYHLRLAVNEADVLAAGCLRRVVDRDSSLGRLEPREASLDDRCDHLIVWQQVGSAPRRVVATCRLLPPHGNDTSPRGSGLCVDQRFGLMPLERLLDATVEVGRVCIHPDHRSGAAASMLWGGIARYLHLTGYRFLLGSAPMDIRDGGRGAAAFWDLALTRHLAPAQRRCRPRDPFAIGGLERAERPRIPPLMRGLLRLGAQVCGPPAHGGTPGTVEFLVLLDLEQADPRYLRRFLGAGG